MRLLGCIAVLGALFTACGDNIRPLTDGPMPDLTTSAVCGDGVLAMAEQCESGTCCTNCTFTAFGTTCRASSGECDAEEICDQLSPDCPANVGKPDGTPCTAGFCQGGVCAPCDINIDADYDGSDQCEDCDDGNALRKPNGTESCDGIDEDCDMKIDEDFDGDMDMYSACSTDPTLFDCNDGDELINPGQPEDCGGGGGNSKDDNCNGYIDEGCAPCTNDDVDDDGVSDCDGDCDDGNPNRTPNKAEACDGLDTDCNTYTTDNCGVSDPCNFVGDADVCKEDLQCGCVVGPSGNCTGDYRCASFCEGSYTGPIGAGCTSTQVCRYRWTLSDNQHACAETTAILGAALAGTVCSQNEDCRSGVCDNLCVGADCQTKRCVDFCDHHEPGAAGSCAAGTVCELITAGGMYASCGIDNNGTRTTGQSCSGGCLWGAASCVNNVCAEPCAEDAHCPAGYHCSLLGNRIATGTWGSGAPAGVSGQAAMETVPVCLADSGPGSHARPGGAACDINGDCMSQLCDKDLKVCVDPCVTDASCAVGLTCEPIYIRPGAATGITWGRGCINPSFGTLVESL